MFIPKNLGKRYARMATKVLDWWLRELVDDASAGSAARIRASTLFLKHFDFLVARDAQALQQDSITEPRKLLISNSTMKVVRERLQLLESGCWLELIDAVEKM